MNMVNVYRSGNVDVNVMDSISLLGIMKLDREIKERIYGNNY